ncbi:hypothetical protein BDF20DRAFT_821747 [Mycotypha africana]|uniref:uncharacterized protein n=1 Tax=Mycotypha africana TaxID=64632 RepID=UPI00230111A1|nr:uncharacterized protein BDF20DRAFT_821747 [Mycotypha africana]KAI8977638.1 hypothetical protein BDF20DRAFT_821747 [Mycotypha africana]
MIVLILYYIYRWLSAPWTYYESARARRVIHQNSFARKARAGLSHGEDEEQHKRIAAELRRHELAGLIWVLISPAVAGYLLQYSRQLVSNADRYVSSVNITVFILAASIKPATHLMNLLHERTIFLQNTLQISDSQVDLLQKKIDKLQKEMDHLHRAFATKKEFAQVTEDIHPTVQQLNKAIKRFEKREQALRNWTDEHFTTIETKIQEFDQYICYRLEQEQRQQTHSTLYTLILLPLNLLFWSANCMTKYMPFIHRGQQRLLTATANMPPKGTAVKADSQRANHKLKAVSHSLTGC